MVDRELLVSKLAEVGSRIERIRNRCPPGESELRRDRDGLEVVAFNLMLAGRL